MLARLGKVQLQGKGPLGPLGSYSPVGANRSRNVQKCPGVHSSLCGASGMPPPRQKTELRDPQCGEIASLMHAHDEKARAEVFEAR